MTSAYDIQRLGAEHLEQLERLVRKAPRIGPYAGRTGPVELLRRAEANFTNLSLGLFDGAKLVGYLLAFVGDAGESARAFGVESLQFGVPRPAVIVAGCAVTPRHQRGVTKLIFRFSQMLREREDLQRLPLCFGCSDALARQLAGRPRICLRLGHKLVRQQPGLDPDSGQPRQWLMFERPALLVRNKRRCVRDALRSIRAYAVSGRTVEVGVIQTMDDWALLEPHWNGLLAATNGGTVFQMYEYQRTWWAHLGVACDLWIVVMLRDGVPMAIVPLQLSLLRWWGDDFRCLSFIGSAPESDRPKVMTADTSEEHLLPLAQYIVAQAGAWDRLFLAEQQPADAFPILLTQQLRAAGYPVLHEPGLACPIVTLKSTWQEFLNGKTRAFRKSIKRKIAKLSEAGKPHFENVEPREPSRLLLNRYLAVERASWKAGTTVGVAQSSALIGFYDSLLARFTTAGGAQFHFLSLDGRTIAATFGLAWNRCFYSLHVAHDEAFADYSPGVVLTAMELQDAFERRAFETFDFLSGTISNKASWATATLPSVDLLATRGAIRGRLFHLIYFHMKPRSKRILARWRLLDPMRRLKRLMGARPDPFDDSDAD